MYLLKLEHKIPKTYSVEIVLFSSSLINNDEPPTSNIEFEFIRNVGEYRPINEKVIPSLKLYSIF